MMLIGKLVIDEVFVFYQLFCWYYVVSTMQVVWKNTKYFFSLKNANVLFCREGSVVVQCKIDYVCRHVSVIWLGCFQSGFLLRVGSFVCSRKVSITLIC